MLYLVIERFKNGDTAAVYRRFTEKGRMLPGGLRYLDSWVDAAGARCFQLMECDDPHLFNEWTSHWCDLVDFELVPVENSRAAAGRQVAERFAAALDHDAFDEAGALLTEDCQYFTGKEILRGPAAIMAPYRQNGEQARRIFDQIEYESAVQVTPAGEPVILFTDRIRKGALTHRFQCRQRLTVGADGKITAIRHEEIDGEREKLETFFAESAVPWQR